MKGASTAVMGWRNLWRNRRRTLITLSSIAFGTLLAIVLTGIGDHSWTVMIDFAARLGTGHVTLQHPAYMDTPSLRKTVANTPTLTKNAMIHEHVNLGVPRIKGQLMLATARQSYAASFMAYDPELETAQTLSLLDNIVEGKAFEAKRAGGIILGTRLADNLGARMGRKVVYTMTDKRGDIVNGLARVSGIISTGSPSVDAGLCLLPIDTVREVLDYDANEATHVAVFVDHQLQTEAVADDLKEVFPAEIAVLTWRETQPELAGFISMKIWGTIIMEIIMLVLIAAGIFNTLFVSVMERMREFGILMAIGFSPAKLFKLVVWESVWLALVGLAAGAVVTALPYYLLHTKGIDLSDTLGGQAGEVAGIALAPILKVNIFPENALAIAAAVLVATMISGLYPAWRAGRVVPVESIRLV